MKSKHIVVLSVVFLWALTSCVFEDELVQDTPPPAAAEVEQVELDAVDTALSELPSSSPAAATKATLPGQYLVERGDTLTDIASRAGIYWNSALWSGIYSANRDKIANPDLILPGTVLSIPALRDEIREGMWEAGRNYENPFGG